MIRTHSGSIQGKYCLWVVNCGLMLSVVLPFIQVQASPHALYVGKKVKPYAGIVCPAQGTQQTQQLEPGTEDEALAIKALLPKASVLRRELATETALKQARGPQILHIARGCQFHL